ncbi:TetR family transcriptional regulator [Rubrivivax sp. A210]|uniref:TetR/AcrR family transcriptional regulator n=1 Tax=Rubrivivax sp. A210 TaxID=2772301 RepID=UPI00191A8E2C|nr:TetR/AcrR family transcriptional regulator [Rubrivivax sp. A210]CAD5366757.1 TetR family transcriptional regulator [Rubrivivax sp. A210]
MRTRLPTEERQAEIVAAALNLARDISPVSITTGDIAAAIGITQGAVFKHFATKEAIWVAAMKWVRERLLEKLDEVARAQTSTVPALEAVFRAHVAFVIAHPGAPRIIFHELQQPADSPVKQEVRALLQAYRQLLLDRLKGGMQSGELPTGLDPEAAATLFVGIVQGLVMQSMLTGKPGAMKAQGDGVFRIYLRGIQAAA